MATFSGGLGLAAYVAAAIQASATVADDAYARVPRAIVPIDFPSPTGAGVLVAGPGEALPPGGTEFEAFFTEGGGAVDWFERIHVIPRSIDLGNLLSNQSVALEVYSAFRRDTHTWTAFNNGAGTGVTLGGAPSLPALLYPQQGYQMTVDVSTIGTPFVDDTLDFFFDVGSTIYVPITITRIVLFWPRPEAAPIEELEFLTDVQRAIGGNEKRHSPRKNPRQAFVYQYKLDEGSDEREQVENMLFDWQGRIFGVPVWFEETELTAAALTGALTVNVTQTAWRDFRVGGLAVVLTSSLAFDVLTIDSIGASSLTFETPLLNDHAIGAAVLPMRVCTAPKTIGARRHRVNLSELGLRFNALDNDISIASTAAFSAYNSKVLLDSDTVVRGTIEEDFEQEVTVIDNDTGVPISVPIVDRHRHSMPYTFRAEGRQAVWELRQLMHALRGKQISFYRVVSTSNLLPILNLLNGSAQLDVQNVGYTQFVRNRQPKNVLRIHFVSGATPLMRTVSGSVIVDATRETLTLNTPWPATYTPAQIERIEYVEKVRIDTDKIALNYDRNGAVCRVTAPLVAVFE